MVCKGIMWKNKELKITQKLKKREQSCSYATYQLNLIRIAIKIHKDIHIGISGYTYSQRKMVGLFATSGNPNQTPRSAASDQGLHCLPVTHLGVSCL